MENSESESKCSEQKDNGSEEYVSSTDNAEFKSECDEQTHSGNNASISTTLRIMNLPMGRCCYTAADLCGPAKVLCIFCSKQLKIVIIEWINH